MPSAETAFLSRNGLDEPLLRLNGPRQCLLCGENLRHAGHLVFVNGDVAALVHQHTKLRQ